MSPYTAAAAKPVEWEVDDAAPTRLRWEKVEDTPSDLAATKVLRMVPPLKTFRSFPDFDDEVRSDVATRVRIVGPGPGVLARMREAEDSDADQPIPLARRRDSSVPTSSDVRAVDADRDSFPPMADESGPAFIPALPPPPNTWIDTRVPPPPPSALAHAVVAPPPPMVVRPQPATEVSNLKLVLIATWAFAVTLMLIMSVAARHVSSML